MSAPYQLNYADMGRFFDDLSHVLQTGGMRSVLSQRGGGITDVLKSIISLVISIVLIYISIKTIKGGYPRMAVNVATFSFFHKQNMDRFLQEDNLLMQSFQTLQYAAPGCQNAYQAIDDIYKTNLGSQLYAKITNLNQTIQRAYPEYKYQEQFYEAFQDFYLYNDKLKATVDVIQQPGDVNKDIKIKNKAFYEQVLGYAATRGFLYREKYIYDKTKNDDSKLLEVYYKDQNNNFNFYNRVLGVKHAIDDVMQASRQIVELMRKHQYQAFVVNPENTLDHQAFNADYQKFKTEITNGSIYAKSYEELNDFSWFLIEYLQYRANPNSFDAFMNEFKTLKYNPKEKYTIKKYLNIPLDQKGIAERRIFNRNLEKRSPKLIDPIILSDAPEPTYPPNQQTSRDFLEFIKKHPIFAHVMFSDDVHDDRRAFYINTMRMYDRFCTNCGSSIDFSLNLETNSIQYKRTTTSIFVFDLYINRYKSQATKLIQDQNYDNKFFFERLWRPYYKDYIVNRMGSEFKRTFSKKTWKKSYKNFWKYWRLLGKIIKSTMKAIFKAFRRGTGVKAPEPEKV